MMKLKIALATVAACALISCGGGGGSPGLPIAAVSGGTGTGTGTGAGTGTTTPATPTVTLQLQDQTGAKTTSVALAGTVAKATVLDAAKAPVANRLVLFETSPTVATLTPSSGQVLTDANGVATIQIAPASLTVAGAGSLKATSVVDSVSYVSAVDYQVSAANLKLQALDVGSGSLPAYGNRALSVKVTVNDTPVTTPVQVAFSATCGVVTPASATTNSSGIASATYSASTAACFGSNVGITASIAGATPVSGQIPILAAAPTNIQFVSSSPQTIYLANSTGATQALVTFKAVDNTGAPIANQTLTLSLVNSGSGVSLDSVGNTAAVTKSTDASGVASVAVFAGSIPTSVQVIASAPGVASTSSNTLRIASGRATQKSTSISLGAFSIEGANVDGITTSVTVSLADRQGNPVPDGTQVNLTSQTGVMVPATCVTSGGTSSCSVVVRSQGARTSNGRVAILAYLPGEEDFVDANSNNVYDAGESFTDLGDAYRDDNENGVFDPGEFTVPRANSTCSLTSSGDPVGGYQGRTGFCDGVWGTSDVRRQIVVVFATSAAKITTYEDKTGVSRTLTTGSAGLWVTDQNGNSMPVGSQIDVSSATTGCTVSSPIKSVPNVYFSKSDTAGTLVPLVLTGCGSGANVTVKVTSPGGVVTLGSFNIM